MGDFGDRLRREREMRGITLEQISESTKIARRRLEALENEEFDLLPGGVFNRGFVRSYARYVGLDPEQAVADYMTASHDQSATADQFPLEVQKNKPQKGAPVLNPQRSWLPIVLAVLALIAVIAGWRIWTHRNPARPVVPSAAAAAIQTATTQPTPDGPGVSGSTPAPGLEPATQDQQDPQNSGAYTLTLTAKSDSWVSIKADGKTVMEGTLNARQVRSVKFENELVLRTGNAGGLEASYNGRPLGGLGAEHETRTFTFPLKAKSP
ncbi:MAG TPA: RodZ domain-containing protein [Candidatus Saccharimonadales bacterium]|jgi:cytoskeletal protein RodZ|nr:RodZ domain-containing protein [Candidatus Saccharimonadales bacterium]